MQCLAEKGGCSELVLNINDEIDHLENIFTCFQPHPSIRAMKQKKKCKEIFDLTLLTIEKVLPEMNKLDQIKSTTGLCISLLIDSSESFAPILTKILYSCIKNRVLRINGN